MNGVKNGVKSWRAPLILLGWVANLVLVGTGLVVTFGLAAIILIINRRAYRRMKELEDV